MTFNRIIFTSTLLLVLVLLQQECVAGPTHTLSLTIPRAIRAPFKNTEMMTARGFGKRSDRVRLLDSTEEGLDFAPYDEGPEDAVHRAPSRRFPLDVIVNQLTTDPNLLRQLIRRFVDANGDGIITEQELLLRQP